MSDGDFNSKDFIPDYNRQVDGFDFIIQLGMNAYKRTNMHLLYSVNRWLARRILFRRNFVFPLFFTEYDLWFALLFGEQKQKDAYKELVYEVLKRSKPKLLYIPIVGDSLPQVDVEPYLTTADSKHHAKEPFLWDYDFVTKNLKPLLNKNDLGRKEKLLLSMLRISELDYFLNKKLEEQIGLYREKKISALQCIKELRKIKKSINYPKTKTRVTMTKELRKDLYIPKLQILMDFASVADKRSFEEVEKFYKNN